MDNQFLFRGSFQQGERDALKGALSHLEKRLDTPADGPSWAIYALDHGQRRPPQRDLKREPKRDPKRNPPGDPTRPGLLAIRLADGRAFRAPTFDGLVDALRPAARKVDSTAW